MHKNRVLIAILLICLGLYYLTRRPAATYTPNDHIIVGTNSDYPPYSFVDNGQLDGFDIEVIKAVADRMGKKIVFKDMPFDALIPDIQVGNIQVIAAGMSYTAPRAKKLYFTQPIFEGSPLAIVTLQHNSSLKNVQDLVGKTVVVNEGYIADLYISSIPGVQVQRLSTDLVSEGILALKSGRAQAFIADMASLKPFLDNHNATMVHVSPLKSGFAADVLAVSLYNRDLFNQIEEVLSQMKQDGSLKAIIQKWFGA